MTHRVSKHGIVGMGALGQALESFLIPLNQEQPGAVLFCTKAFDLEAALTEQAGKWPIETPFVVMCNGFIWPIIEKLVPQLGSRPVRIGMTTIGSTIEPDGKLKVFSKNTVTAWGNWGTAKTPPLENELRVLELFPNSEWCEDIRPKIREKWILNVVINTLGGAYRLPTNSQVKRHREEAESLLLEAFNLSKVIFKDVNDDISIEQMRKKLWKLVEATSGNENSMAKDVRLNRKTESDFLTGIAAAFDGYPQMKRLHEMIPTR